MIRQERKKRVLLHGSAHLGVVAEIEAAAWLVRRGFFVFRNMSPVGPIDLVAVRSATTEVLFLDVKLGRRYLRRDGTIVSRSGDLTRAQSAQGIRKIVVFDDSVELEGYEYLEPDFEPDFDFYDPEEDQTPGNHE